MNVEILVSQLEIEIKKIYAQHPQTRKKTLKMLRDLKGLTNVKRQLLNTVVDGVQHLISDAKTQKERASRYETIPKFYPAPEPTSALDCLIYSRMIMGYTLMPSGHHGRRLQASMRKLKTKEKYVEYLLKYSDDEPLGQRSFRYLCQIGCPQATIEWMLVHDVPPALIANQSVIASSQRLLAEYGY
jgi:hypothetical protein